MILPLPTSLLLEQTAPRKLPPSIEGQELPGNGGVTIPPIEAAGTRGWKRQAITPDKLAQQADARLNGVKNAISEWLSTVKIPSGYGQSFGRNVMYVPGRFRIEVTRTGRRDEDLNKLVWSGNGGRTQVLDQGGWQKRPDFRVLPTPLAPAFLLGFDNIVMRGTQGAKPFAALVASARKQGYTMVVERRVSDQIKGESEIRLLMTKGATRYSISWNARRMLPNRIALEGMGAKQRPVRIVWLSSWAVKGSPLTAWDVKNVHPSSNEPFKVR